jgi:phosphoenolpyruvate carboxylase
MPLSINFTPQHAIRFSNLFCMSSVTNRQLENFKTTVGLKFQLYNSLFTSLPFHRIEKTGIMLSLFLNHCEESYKKKLKSQRDHRPVF